MMELVSTWLVMTAVFIILLLLFRNVVISTGQVTKLAGGGSSSFKDLTDENVFSLEARKEAGTQLRKIQRGDDPDEYGQES